MNDDTINRLAAIDALMEEFKRIPTTAIRAKNTIEGLPSAQPEITLESAIDYLRSIGWMQEHDRIMSASAQSDLIAKIQNGIKVTNADDIYSCGMRNGMRWCISLINDKEPLYENCPSVQPEITGKNMLEWLLAYQTKSFELHGRYKAHEVIWWLIHDISNNLLVNDGSDDVKGKENG